MRAGAAGEAESENYFPMTEKQQRRFFFPRWTEACRVLKWSEASGRLTIDKEKLNAHGRRAFAAAVQRAGREHRAPTMSDLRHGVIIAAIGRDKDTLKLSNSEQNSILDYMRLCANECDIGADQRRSNPAGYEVAALVAKIKKLGIPFAIIDDVCKRSFAPVYSSPFYEDMPLPSLRALCGILTEMSLRAAAKRATPLPEPVLAGGDDEGDPV